MIEDFDRMVLAATEGSYFISVEGLPAAYELLMHLAGGGNINEIPDWTPEEAQIFLAAMYNTVRQMVQINQEFGDIVEDDETDS